MATRSNVRQQEPKPIRKVLTRHKVMQYYLHLRHCLYRLAHDSHLPSNFGLHARENFRKLLLADAQEPSVPSRVENCQLFEDFIAQAQLLPPREPFWGRVINLCPRTQPMPSWPSSASVLPPF